MSKFSWAYGVTTVVARRDTLLPRTLQSLAHAGFDVPRLFVDGARHAQATEYEHKFGLEVTSRFPCLFAFGNWAFALAELYTRSPAADFYAIFQDDIAVCRNTRLYVERSANHSKAYWNLYTTPSNLKHIHGKLGWNPSHQLGFGALGLVFKREAVQDLLAHPDFVRRPTDVVLGRKNIDGCVLECLKSRGYQELIHNPSMVQHMGADCSSLGNEPRPLSKCWRGENFDMMECLLENRRLASR